MSDAIDTLADLRHYRQEKRAGNQAFSSNLLREAGIAFTSHNGGVHLVITTAVATFDFWPSTGRVINRTTGTQHRGVRNLLRILKGQTWTSKNSAASSGAPASCTPSAPSLPRRST